MMKPNNFYSGRDDTRPNARPCASVVAVLAIMTLATTAAVAQPSYISRADYLAGYEARCDSILDFYAHRIDSTDLSSGGYYDIAAKLDRGIHMSWVETRLDTLLAAPRGDMFWMFPFIMVTYSGRDNLSPAYKAKMRDAWRTYTPYRGDTENHWAMYYAAMYLITQEYPGEPPSAWFNGRSSEENFREAEEYLIEWMNITTTIGQGEYDSPGYLNYFIIPMAQLYAYASDPAMKLRAEMMLDYLLADFAVESLNGIHTGASSRIYPRALLQRWRENSSHLAWLFFGNTPFQARSGGPIVALSGYRLPEIIYYMATDRSEPYVHREYKRTRHRIRNSELKNAPVYKYTYMRPEYAFGSSQGGLLQPIQQHTWELQWATAEPEEGYNMLFVNHPYSDPFEGTMYFAEHWDMVTELIVRSKTEYDSPEKWTGGSPYEQIVQEKDALIALYNIEKGTRFEHISGFFSRKLADLEEDASGWIFARGGDAYIGYYPLAPYEWRDEEDGSRRLHSPHLRNGAVIQVAPVSDYASLDDFASKVRMLPIETKTAPVPSVRFETLRGDTIESTYGSRPIVNGARLDYENWPLFDGPFLMAKRNSRTLDMRYGTLRRTLDFANLRITESVVDGDYQPSTSTY